MKENTQINPTTATTSTGGQGDTIWVTCPRNQILHGNSLQVLKTLPSNSINCCVTSPPYWSLRDYQVNGQLGLEATPEEYISKLCDIFDEVKRVLREDGTCWVNLGDSYFNKSLVNIPHRFAIEMTNRGWLLRNSIVWWKPNCMPSSVSDRFTVDYEMLFFFTKSTKYYFKQQLEAIADSTLKRMQYGLNGKDSKYNAGVHPMSVDSWNKAYDKLQKNPVRNKRCVWKISPSKYRDAHFATYPEALIQSPIDAGCPEYICNQCGKPRIEVKEKMNNIKQEDRVAYKETKKCGDKLTEVNTCPRPSEIEQYKVVGLSDCGCNAGYHKGIVLDPFFGAGTTGVVANKQGKDFIGIELNHEYIDLANKRLAATKE